MDQLPIFQVITSLAVVLAAIWALGKGFAYWKQRGQGPGSGKSRRLQLVESLFIDTQHRLVLVQYDEEEHLILLGSKGKTLLSSTPAPQTATQKLSSVAPA